MDWRVTVWPRSSYDHLRGLNSSKECSSLSQSRQALPTFKCGVFPNTSTEVLVLKEHFIMSWKIDEILF